MTLNLNRLLTGRQIPAKLSVKRKRKFVTFVIKPAIDSPTGWFLNILKRKLNLAYAKVRKVPASWLSKNKLHLALVTTNVLEKSELGQKFNNYWTASSGLFHINELNSQILRRLRLSSSALFLFIPIRRKILEYNKLNSNVRLFLYENLKLRTFKKRITYLRSIWLWRVSQKNLTPQRHEFRILSRKRFKYQHKLTRYILKFYRFKSLEFVLKTEFNLKNILIKSQLTLNWILTSTLLSLKFVRVNGVCVNNWDAQLFPFDVIQLAISRSYFIYYKWSSLSQKHVFKRFIYFTKFWRQRQFRPYPKQSSYRIPHWVIHMKFRHDSIPPFLEVSLNLLTAIVLRSYYYNIQFYNSLLLNQTLYSVTRAYNWKFLS